MTQRILMISYSIPPSNLSTGHLRTLGFARYLPEYDWSPIILSAHPRAYSTVDLQSQSLIPPECPVYRAFALDARRHLGLRGVYPVLLAQPDRWASWWFGAVPLGLRLIRKYRVSAIWSTYPIITAHMIAYTLHRLTRVPWIADFRDPVSNLDIGNSRLTASTRSLVERGTLSRADKCVFTTHASVQLYGHHYPAALDSKRLSVIPNGFDEADFEHLEPRPKQKTPVVLKLVHSGVLYRKGRNPSNFFKALAQLKQDGMITAESIGVVLRASSHEEQYTAETHDLDIADMVQLPPRISYSEALQEQANADGLLLFQGAEYSRQIPAKIYEYLRLGTPILAFTEETGDTASLLRSTGGAVVASLDDQAQIKAALMKFINMFRSKELPSPDQSIVRMYSRREGAHRLADMLNEIKR